MTVPKSVWDHVYDYFDKKLKSYEVIDVIKSSSHPMDNYLYMVVAYHVPSGSWTFWSCWNDKMRSLNHGHYDISDYDDALSQCLSFQRK